MIIAVAEFNKKRNGLEFKEELEASLLAEEIKEFWDATTTAERLDALVDTEYVWEGTRIKASYNGFFIQDYTRSYVDDSISLMHSYLQDELGSNFYDCYGNAKKIVCNANAIKGSKLDDNGKVKKDDEYNRKVNATEQIKEMIYEVTCVKSY